MPETKILVITDYPLGRAPGPRFRYEQYLSYFRETGFGVDLAPFYDGPTCDILYKPGYLARKTWGVLRGFLRRMKSIARVSNYEYVFLYREAAPIGPPLFEALLFALKKRVIYDFDDAIFLRSQSGVNPLAAWLKWPSKVAYAVRRSYKVSVCNPFLVNWAKQFNDRVVLIPTSIDPEYHSPRPKKHSGRIVIGWTGSHSTAPYLELVRPVLRRLEQDYDFDFQVICDTDPGFPELRNYRFLPWRRETEIEDLNEIDIGIMPVPEGTWEKGKVGFKAIQYSAMGIAPVVSEVGSGHEVVQDGTTGLVVRNTEDDWVEALASLLREPQRITTLGRAAREYILQGYSVPALRERYRGLFN
ncbi:MAG: glycosyltransferase family 4 protein [Terriglobales bacterium]